MVFQIVSMNVLEMLEVLGLPFHFHSQNLLI